LESPGTLRERCAIALKAPWGRNANASESPWTPCNRCRSPWHSHGDLTTDSLRCHDVLGDCTALSRRLHGIPTAFFKGRWSHGVCNLQQNTKSAPRRYRRLHGVSWRCWRSARRSGSSHGDLVTIQIAVRTLP
jgi:hypothetical protein